MHAHVATGCFGVLLALAALSDVARRRIPNYLSVPIAATGFVAQMLSAGWPGAANGLVAALLLGASLWIPWTRGWIGGGDLKLGAAAAIWVGPGGLPRYVLAAAVVAGAAGVASYVASTRAARTEMRSNLRTAVAGRPAWLWIPARGGGGRVSVPAGAALAAGALFAVLAGG